MSAYVEECRREWRRLGVPDLLADEMAADLEADLAEAQADGVSEAEILGESDPRRFAAACASERGLVSAEPPPKKSLTWLWIVLAVVVAFLVFLGTGAVLAFGLFASTSVSSSRSRAVQVQVSPAITAVLVPSLVGLEACHATRIALNAGLEVDNVPTRRCDAMVVHQRPAAGRHVEPRTRLTLRFGRS
jgi:hypothetical protein